MTPTPERTTIEALRARHAVLLLDAYGVLLDHGGPLPGAAALLARLNREGQPYLVLSNDGSRLPPSAAARLAGMGLPVPVERLLTSLSLLPAHFAAAGHVGARCAVLGPADSLLAVEQAGGVVVAPGEVAEVLVVCDEVGYPFVEAVDAVLTGLLHRLDAGDPVQLILPNPDLIYPKARGTYGFTAGSIAALIEAVLCQRYSGSPELRFVSLGKPGGLIFAEAARRAGTMDLVMVGDQLLTDVKGALDFGIPAALIETGLDRYREGNPVRPTYLLSSLES